LLVGANQFCTGEKEESRGEDGILKSFRVLWRQEEEAFTSGSALLCAILINFFPNASNSMTLEFIFIFMHVLEAEDSAFILLSSRLGKALELE
jgi:hypothetical protein